MFEPNPHARHRGRPRDVRPDRGWHHHQGPANPAFSLRDLLGRDRPGAAVRRGEIRPLILSVLLQKPMHGYEVIQELEAQSGGRWRPSAGSVYPTLQLLADEGLVTSEDVDGRRTYSLTDEGRAAAATSATRSPWTDGDASSERQPDIRQLAIQLAGAVMQVQRMGSPKARGEATRILTDARRQMYRLLADDEVAAADDEVATPDDQEPGPA